MANTSGNGAGANFGQKVRGAWNAVEGAGDKLRGGAMDFVDSATGTGGHHAETDVGDAKMRQGVAQTRQPATTGTATTTAAPASTTANAPTTAAPASTPTNASTTAAPASAQTNASTTAPAVGAQPSNTAAPAVGAQPSTAATTNGNTGVTGTTN
ncbi:uncharacterized protein B0H18DRAFT_1013548 [Fomitopsis serialis]|uniref:uncharacterized protein n=1 Tax=Fomitopsis serialis TaxID=139415 RepID=UPI002008E7CA|nr:uncharacterized protein B0H18DRAFT_1013548 [Neoantrodia serialis]KAH9923828.1 hypothetical protein B0H18DRAFT_1013548 [Neoantrodia serialis]